MIKSAQLIFPTPDWGAIFVTTEDSSIKKIGDLQGKILATPHISREWYCHQYQRTCLEELCGVALIIGKVGQQTGRIYGSNPVPIIRDTKSYKPGGDHTRNDEPLLSGGLLRNQLPQFRCFRRTEQQSCFNKWLQALADISVFEGDFTKPDDLELLLKKSSVQSRVFHSLKYIDAAGPPLIS